jgi:hypothetical protein
MLLPFNDTPCRRPIVPLTCIFLCFCSDLAPAELIDYGFCSGYGTAKGILVNDHRKPLSASVTGNNHSQLSSKADLRASIVYAENEFKQASHIAQGTQASLGNINLTDWQQQRKDQ